MKTLVQDEAKRLNELLQKAFDCFEVLSCLSTNSNNKSEDNINFIDYLNEYESNSVTESMKQLHVCENKLKSIENTSQLFDSKDISLLRRTHKHTISVCEVLVPIKDDLIERTNTPETDTTTSTPEYTAFLSLFKELCLQTYEFTNSTLEDIDAKIAFSSDLTDKIRLLEESKRTLGIRLNTAKERKEKVEYDLSSEIAMLQSELKELTKVNNTNIYL